MSEFTFEGLRALARHHRQSFGRHISCEVYRTDEGILAITRMHDDFHDMELALLVDFEQLTILAAHARMERIPFGTCFEAIPALTSLEGLCIFQPGVLKEARARMPREAGCTHLGEMFESTLRALFAHIASHGRVRLRDHLSLEERRQLNIAHKTLRGTCRTFRASDEDPQILEQARERVAVLARESMDAGRLADVEGGPSPASSEKTVHAAGGYDV
jgi:hypothetical protein